MTVATRRARGDGEPWLGRVDLSSPGVIVGTLAVFAALAGLGLVLMTVAMSSPGVAPGTEVRAGALSVWVNSSEWLASDHGGHDDGEEAEVGAPASTEIADLTQQADSFAMPASMMPGTPDPGYQRLQIDLSILNRGQAVAAVSPAEFHLENAAGEIWPANHGGTFNATQLQGSHTMYTVVAFDVAEEMIDDSLVLVWSVNDNTTQFAISTSGDHHG